MKEETAKRDLAKDPETPVKRNPGDFVRLTAGFPSICTR